MLFEIIQKAKCRMRIAVFCATARGYKFLARLSELVPDADFIVCSFPETPHEPPFLNDIRQLTEQIGGQFIETRHVGKADLLDMWRATPTDLMFAVSWRYLVPSSVYSQPKHGMFVFHDSLLPKYRGFSPTVWAIVNGETETGATLFRIAEDVDSGDVVDQERIPIYGDDTIANVMERVTQAYLLLIERNIDALLSGIASLVPQIHEHATFTCMRLPDDNLIDWGQSTQQIYNLIRATTLPYPGAYTYFDGRILRIWSAEVVKHFPTYVGRISGRVVSIVSGIGVTVLTGDGAILVKEVSIDNQDIVPAPEVITRMSTTLGVR